MQKNKLLTNIKVFNSRNERRDWLSRLIDAEISTYYLPPPSKTSYLASKTAHYIHHTLRKITFLLSLVIQTKCTTTERNRRQNEYKSEAHLKRKKTQRTHIHKHARACKKSKQIDQRPESCTYTNGTGFLPLAARIYIYMCIRECRYVKGTV